MILYHVTTPKKAKLYKEQCKIISPVRGFNSFTGDLAWSCKVGRTVVVIRFHKNDSSKRFIVDCLL